VTESDERVLIEAAQKDPGRFAELYEQNFNRVYAYVARRIMIDLKHRTSPRMSFNKPSQTSASSNGVALHSSPGFIELLQTQLPIRLERSHAN